MRRPTLLFLSAISGAVAVAAGAFGAHDASGRAAELLRTGGEYELAHAVAALVAARSVASRWPAGLLLGGSALFAGSLYALAAGAPRWLGVVTPLGGAAMIGGWIALAILALREPHHPETRS